MNNQQTSHKHAILSETAPAPIGPYSQAIQSGRTVYVSGQIPLCPITNTIPSKLSDQIHLSLKNLVAVLDAATLTTDDVIKTNIYLTDMAHFDTVNRIYSTYFTAPYPARAVIAVAGLPKSVLIEIEAIAVNPALS